MESAPPPERRVDRKGAEIAAKFMERWDSNGDGKVARAEFDGPASHFDEFDRDRDGFIVRAEAPTRPPPGGPGDDPRDDDPDAPPGGPPDDAP
jgi:hypothetical protein